MGHPVPDLYVSGCLVRKVGRGGVHEVRVFRRALGIEGKAVVTRVTLSTDGDEVVVSVRPFKCAPLQCGRCGRVAPGEDKGRGRRRWRGMDWGPLKVFIEADARRVCCPEHGSTVVRVPWAAHRARHTHDVDATVAWLARHCPKYSAS